MLENNDGSTADMILIIMSLKERRRQLLYQFLNFVCDKIDVRKFSDKDISEKRLIEVISQIEYSDLIEFRDQLGYRPTYNIPNIIYDVSGIRIEKPENNYTKKLNREIKAYENFVTNPLNIKLPKKMIQKSSTFHSITMRGIRRFIEYLISQKNIPLDEINSLFEYILDYFLDFLCYLRSLCPTTSVSFYMRFIRSIFYFYRNHRHITEEQNERMDELTSDRKKLMDRMNFEDSKRIKNKKLRQKTEAIELIDTITLLEEEYKVNKKYITLKALLVTKLLVHMGWRASNYINLKIGETLIYENGKWHYRFKPEQQKAPIVEHGKYITIEGVFPKRLQDNITELLNHTKSKDYLLKTQGGGKYSSSAFCQYVKKITKKYMEKELNPHIFRNIVFSHLIRKGYNPVNAELFLWHKPKTLSSVDFSYLEIDVDNAVKYVNHKLEKLYKVHSNKKKRKQTAIKKDDTPSNVITFPKSS